MSGNASELTKRVGVAAVGIPLVVGLSYLGGYWLAGLIAAFGALAAWEFCDMYRSAGSAAAPAVAGLLALAYVLMAASMPPGPFVTWAVIVTLGVGSVVMLQAALESAPAQTVVITLFGAAYTGGLLSFAVWLRALDMGAPGLRGAAILFLPIAVTWLGDTAAYSTGRAIGRHKMAPAISPKKTWEGAIGGFLATVAGAWIYTVLTGPLVDWTMTTVQILGFGAVVSVAGQVGDLFESRFKRECGVKDSSALLPGHGGFFDRVDSLLFALPIAYAYLKMTGV